VISQKSSIPSEKQKSANSCKQPKTTKMLHKRHYYLILIIGLTWLTTGSSAATCSSAYTQSPSSGGSWLNMYTYTCAAGGTGSVTTPTLATTYASTTQKLALSPNLYTSIPYTQLCQFTYVTTLVMSNNQLASLTAAFTTANLGCLTALTTVDFSNNLIASPLAQADFDDTTAAQIVSLNLTNNMIPSLSTSMFFKADGVTSRFPNLRYLGLALNNLKNFDLLWPMSLPQSTLLVELQVNPISTLENQLAVSYADARFAYPIAGNRKVNVQNNKLQYLDDTNLLQYKLGKSSDFVAFVNKILNFDFTQTNGDIVFFCICQYSTNINTWYQQSYSQLQSGNYPIYKLYCNEYTNNVYVFNFGTFCNINVLL
jgi:hypothetical protein